MIFSCCESTRMLLKGKLLQTPIRTTTNHPFRGCHCCQSLRGIRQAEHIRWSLAPKRCHHRSNCHWKWSPRELLGHCQWRLAVLLHLPLSPAKTNSNTRHFCVSFSLFLNDFSVFNTIFCRCCFSFSCTGCVQRCTKCLANGCNLFSCRFDHLVI